MSNLDRRSFLGALTAGAGLTQAAAMEGQLAESAKPSSRHGRKPMNVLFLMSDQHRPEALGIRGGTIARTPNLDKLAQRGVLFDHAYCTDPVCVPSRPSMLTGLYPHNLAKGHYSSLTNYWPHSAKTIAHYFSGSGYMTGLVGKMHFVDGQTHGFDYFLGFNDWFQYLGPKTRIFAQENVADLGGSLPEIPDLWQKTGGPWAGVIERDDRENLANVGHISSLPEEDHFESFVSRETIRFLRNFGREQPFFLISSFLKPHAPFMPAERFANMFHVVDMELPDTWGKVDLATVPQVIRESIHYNWPTPELRYPENAKRRIAMYYGNVAQMDDNLGKVLRALQELDLEKNTIIVYTADHGEMLGAHGLWQKFVLYEPSVGVPLIVRVPGVTPSSVRCETPVSHIQMLPTLAELCDVSIPSDLDGTSFVENLKSPHRTTNRTIFAERGLGSRHAAFMIRDGDFKYNYYVDDMPELYNLRTDPEEMRNLALLPAYQSKVSEMKGKLFAWHRPENLRG